MENHGSHSQEILGILGIWLNPTHMGNSENMRLNHHNYLWGYDWIYQRCPSSTSSVWAPFCSLTPHIKRRVFAIILPILWLVFCIIEINYDELVLLLWHTHIIWCVYIYIYMQWSTPLFCQLPLAKPFHFWLTWPRTPPASQCLTSAAVQRGNLVTAAPEGRDARSGSFRAFPLVTRGWTKLLSSDWKIISIKWFFVIEISSPLPLYCVSIMGKLEKKQNWL